MLSIASGSRATIERASRRRAPGARGERAWPRWYASLVHMEDPVSWPLDETSQPIELLLSVDRDGAAHARRADRGPAPRARSATGALRARRARAVDARPRPPARRLAAGRRRRLRAARRRGLPEPAPGRAPARRPTPPRRGAGAGPRAGAAAAPPRFDFRPSVPDVSTFPRAAWLRSLREALATMHRRRPRLRRPARRRGAARGARRLPRPRARRRRRPGARRRHQRLHAGARARLPRARAPRGARADRARGPEQPRAAR